MFHTLGLGILIGIGSCMILSTRKQIIKIAKNVGGVTMLPAFFLSAIAMWSNRYFDRGMAYPLGNNLHLVNVIDSLGNSYQVIVPLNEQHDVEFNSKTLKEMGIGLTLTGTLTDIENIPGIKILECDDPID